MARVSRKRKNIPTNETASHIWRTALYVRLSVEDNGKDADSIENQIALEYVLYHMFLGVLI